MEPLLYSQRLGLERWRGPRVILGAQSNAAYVLFHARAQVTASSTEMTYTYYGSASDVRNNSGGMCEAIDLPLHTPHHLERGRRSVGQHPFDRKVVPDIDAAAGAGDR